jgi:hypothetical protein
MEIPFEQACGLVKSGLEVRAEIVSGLSAPTLGKALAALGDAMRANRLRARSQQIFLDRVISSYDGRTRADGFHILHDWDGVRQQTNPDIIPVDVLRFLSAQRGADEAGESELAILIDYYFMHVLALLTMRIWDAGDPDENLETLNALVAELQGPGGSGHQFAADAETLMLIGTSHYEPNEWGYGKLLAKVRGLGDRHQFRIGLGHASSMGCHLRFGFEAQCGRDTLALRDDNVADYPWLCFALAAVMREFARLAEAGIENRDRSVIEEALLNGLTADARAFIGVAPASLSGSEADRAQFLEGFMRHKPALLEAFPRYRPSESAYSPLSLFFNFSHNVVKGTVVDALLWGEAWDVSLNDLLSGVPRSGLEEGSQQLLATTLMAYARSNPDRIRGKLMPVIVYDPQSGRRAYTVTMEKLAIPA